MCYVVSAAYLHALSWESLTLCKPGCCLLTVFCHFPGLELLKNWCVKGYHTGAGMDLAQMVRITVGKVGRDGCLPAQSWVEILLVLPPLAPVLPVCLLPSLPRPPGVWEKPVLPYFPQT